MFNATGQKSSSSRTEPPDVTAAAEESAAAVAEGPARLDEALAEAEGRSAPTRAEMRASCEDLRRRLAAEEAALEEAEVATRRDLQEAFREWYGRRGDEAREELDQAAAFALGRELREVTANRDVVLSTTHPTLHRDIAKAFDSRIELLTQRAKELLAPIPEEGEESPAVFAGVAWARQEPPVLEAVVLRFEPGDLRDGVAGAFRDLALELEGNGEVQAIDEEGEPLRLMAGIGLAAARGNRDVAGRLSGLITDRLARTEAWPTGARALVEALDRGRVASLDAALWPPESTA
jgi:hypothetical protein